MSLQIDTNQWWVRERGLLTWGVDKIVQFKWVTKTLYSIKQYTNVFVDLSLSHVCECTSALTYIALCYVFPSMYFAYHMNVCRLISVDFYSCLLPLSTSTYINHFLSFTILSNTHTHTHTHTHTCMSVWRELLSRDWMWAYCVCYVLKLNNFESNILYLCLYDRGSTPQDLTIVHTALLTLLLESHIRFMTNTICNEACDL